DGDRAGRGRVTGLSGGCEQNWKREADLARPAVAGGGGFHPPHQVADFPDRARREFEHRRMPAGDIERYAGDAAHADRDVGALRSLPFDEAAADAVVRALVIEWQVVRP